MATPLKTTHSLSLPFSVEIRQLRADDEEKFIEEAMRQPGNCDNDLSEAENRQWFRQMWQWQIRFQAALLTKETLMSGFLRYVALAHLGAETNEDVGVAIEDAIRPVVESLGEGAAEHFYPHEDLGVTTWTMVSEVLNSVALKAIPSPT